MKKQTNLGRKLEKVETGNIQSISYLLHYLLALVQTLLYQFSDLQSLPKLSLVKTILKTWIKTSLSSLCKYLCLRGNLQLRFQLLSWIPPRRLWFPCWNHGAAGWKWCNVTFTRGIYAINCFLWVWEGAGVCTLRVHPTTNLSCTKEKNWSQVSLLEEMQHRHQNDTLPPTVRYWHAPVCSHVQVGCNFQF